MQKLILHICELRLKKKKTHTPRFPVAQALPSELSRPVNQGQVQLGGRRAANCPLPHFTPSFAGNSYFLSFACHWPAPHPLSFPTHALPSPYSSSLFLFLLFPLPTPQLPSTPLLPLILLPTDNKPILLTVLYNWIPLHSLPGEGRYKIKGGTNLVSYTFLLGNQVTCA